MQRPRVCAAFSNYCAELMEPTYFAQYRGFEFQCSPERLDAGAFAPHLVIHDAHQSVTLEIALGVASAPFQNPTAAAHQAFAHGRRWVDGGYRAEDLPAGATPRLIDGTIPLLAR